uniref:Uncharacterized protein n=1 Tax=Cucumis melo TaxID=3656 RepID=A0A9I9EIN7_CUCME
MWCLSKNLSHFINLGLCRRRISRDIFLEFVEGVPRYDAFYMPSVGQSRVFDSRYKLTYVNYCFNEFLEEDCAKKWANKLTICHFDLEFINIRKEMEAAFENLNNDSTGFAIENKENFGAASLRSRSLRITFAILEDRLFSFEIPLLIFLPLSEQFTFMNEGSFGKF